MSHRKFHVLFLVLMLASNEGFADYRSYGVGAKSCGAWIESRKENNYYDMAQWMLGFVSATNYYHYDLRDVDGKALIVWMDNYCQAHPLDEFDVGVIALIESLRMPSGASTPE